MKKKNVALYFFLINGRLFLLISCIYIIILHLVLKIKHKAHWPRYSPEKHLIAKHKFEQKRLLKGRDYYLPLTTSMTFHLNKCYPLHIWTLYAKCGWNWPGSSEEKGFKMSSMYFLYHLSFGKRIAVSKTNLTHLTELCNYLCTLFWCIINISIIVLFRVACKKKARIDRQIL